MRSDLPHGPPVLQLTQPLPLFRPNHLRKLSLLLLFFGTFLTPVLCAYFSALYQSPRSISRRPRSTIACITGLHFLITCVTFGLFCWHYLFHLWKKFVRIIMLFKGKGIKLWMKLTKTHLYQKYGQLY